MSPAINPQSPLILTLRLDSASHQLLTSLRSKYFPPHRNFLTAHVTLFHAIPSHRYPELDSYLNNLVEKHREKGGWDVFLGEPEPMGNRGVYLRLRERPSNTTENLRSQLLHDLKKGIKEEKDKLTNQDLQTMKRPHVTVLNKARDEEEVEKCLKEVKEVFEKMGEKGQHVGRATGFELWEYLGGPWKHVKAYSFGGPAAEDQDKE
ncbi:hypothetical protein CI109_100435 [Kwoniella shandongensis]|uniref:Uncharacterized protein n=1 Tax=Kwoniella shandongensis TaxID=1734106 RepID=A0A5M6C7K8_9TREE|nr:uncharacterized protein CI109_001721 [Kwoniella shandongensis]KAA5529782.1 hypothetical protein CI109_001721 [Kwoniella shandongensis]